MLTFTKNYKQVNVRQSRHSYYLHQHLIAQECTQRYWTQGAFILKEPTGYIWRHVVDGDVQVPQDHRQLGHLLRSVGTKGQNPGITRTDISLTNTNTTQTKTQKMFCVWNIDQTLVLSEVGEQLEHVLIGQFAAVLPVQRRKAGAFI